MPDPVTHTLDVPGAVLTYDVRGDLADQPVLLMIGSPMGASGFPTLASHFADRTVVTYDPRGVERSTRSDGAGELSPNDHAGDLAALIEALDAGPVELFASSGGAVNALALMAQRPDLVKTLVAHEPPLAGIIPDHEAALAACEDIYQTYQRDGMGAGMAKFIAIVGYEGEIPADYTDQPAPDPAMFGLPTEDDGSRDDLMLSGNMVALPPYEPAYETIKAGTPRVVIGVGADTGDELTGRSARATAALLDAEPVVFPGGHGGFGGGEYGQPADKPVEFAAKLRGVLAG